MRYLPEMVIFHLSDDQKHLIEVKRYHQNAWMMRWCMAHRDATIFIYYARPGLSRWFGWGKDSHTMIPLSGDLLLSQVTVLNTHPVPFGNPDDWRALSDGPAPSTEEDYDPYYTLEHE